MFDDNNSVNIPTLYHIIFYSDDCQITFFTDNSSVANFDFNQRPASSSLILSNQQPSSLISSTTFDSSIRALSTVLLYPSPRVFFTFVAVVLVNDLRR
jgi:hypothetical protein